MVIDEGSGTIDDVSVPGSTSSRALLMTTVLRRGLCGARYGREGKPRHFGRRLFTHTYRERPLMTPFRLPSGLMEV